MMPEHSPDPLEGEPVELTVIVPCFNEEEALPRFLKAVVPELDEWTAGAWRLLFVDDGSVDRTMNLIEEAHRSEPRIEAVKLSRNFGHQPALAAGLPFATGRFIGILDCDLQDPVSVLGELLNAAKTEELDVCYGIRGKRQAPPGLRFCYWLFYRILNLTATHPWPLDAGDFCVMSRRCQRALLALPESSRMFRGLRSWVGMKQRGIPYDRPARLEGESKYSIRRLVRLALSGLISFSTAPLKLASFVGFGMALFSMVAAVFVLINRFFPAFTLFGYSVGTNAGVTTIVLLICFVSSMGFICLGIIGEYLALVLQELKRRPTAVIDRTLGLSRRAPAEYGIVVAESRLDAIRGGGEWSAGRSIGKEKI